MRKAKASVVTQICLKVYFAQEVLLPSRCCVAFRVIIPELSLQDLLPGPFWEEKCASQLLQSCPQVFHPLLGMPQWLFCLFVLSGAHPGVSGTVSLILVFWFPS